MTIDVELMADEAIDVDVADVIETGGSGGTTNYNLLTNKPRINGIELKGDKSIKDLGIDVAINEEVAEYVTEHKAELKGEPGKDGASGKDGTNGKDGFSPIAIVSQMIGGAVLTVTDKNGTTSATISNGVDGKDGSDGQNGTNGIDGFSPIATVTQTTTGATVTITDKNGTTSAQLTNGQNGTPGTPGTNGKDGKDYVITSADYDNIADVVLGKLVSAESVSV